MANRKTTEEMTALFECLDVVKLVRDVFLDGFETYADYVKYGDMFIHCELVSVVYTPAERQLTA